MYERQKEFPNSPLFNMYPMLMKLKDWVDMKKMSEALIKTAQAHPACLSVIEEHNGVSFQRYVPDLITDVKIEKISEAEFQSMINTLIQPFYPDDAPLRLRLFETEKAKYFFIDTYHVFCDAFAKVVFVYDLDKAYAGVELEQDGWFSYLEEREQAKFSPHYQESRAYYENLYGKIEWSRYPKTDFPDGRENEHALLSGDIEICPSDLDILKNYHLTYNEFFSAISLLSTAMFNNVENVLNTWTYKGRWKKFHHNIVGNMIMDMPLALNVKNMTANQIFKSVREQVKGGLLHRDYSYTMLDEKILRDDILCFIYHGGIAAVPAKINLFESMVINFHNFSRGNGTSDNIIDVEIREENNKFLLFTDYAAHKYKHETVKKFANILISNTHKLLKLMRENKSDDEVLF